MKFDVNAEGNCFGERRTIGLCEQHIALDYKGNLAKDECEVIRSDSARGNHIYIYIRGIGLAMAKEQSNGQPVETHRAQVLKIQGKPPTV